MKLKIKQNLCIDKNTKIIYTFDIIDDNCYLVWQLLQHDIYELKDIYTKTSFYFLYDIEHQNIEQILLPL